MTNYRDTLLVGAAMILGTVTGTQAADLYGGRGGLKDYGYTPQLVEQSARIYGRIDGGYAGYDDPNMVLNMQGAQQEVIDTSIDSSGTIGGGFGLYFSKNVRADVTYTHLFERDVRGSFGIDVPGAYDPTGTGACPGNPCNTPGQRRLVHGKNGLSSDVVLASVYYDFGARGRFSPYLGFGLGAVHHSVKAGTLASADGTITGVIDGHDSWHAAGALMAGFSMALRERLHIDAGYRFMYLGETATGATRATVPTSTAVTTPVTMPAGEDPTIEAIHSHEFRVGLRYDIR